MIVKPIWDKTAGWVDEQEQWWKENNGKEVKGKLIDNPDGSGEKVFLPGNLPKGVRLFLYEDECHVVDSSGGYWDD